MNFWIRTLHIGFLRFSFLAGLVCASLCVWEKECVPVAGLLVFTSLWPQGAKGCFFTVTSPAQVTHLSTRGESGTEVTTAWNLTCDIKKWIESPRCHTTTTTHLAAIIWIVWNGQIKVQMDTKCPVDSHYTWVNTYSLNTCDLSERYLELILSARLTPAL